MDQYFERMAGVQASADMPSRIRFMVENVIEMRDNGWAPRKVATELTPQTIGEIRQAFPHMRVRAVLHCLVAFLVFLLLPELFIMAYFAKNCDMTVSILTVGMKEPHICRWIIIVCSVAHPLVQLRTPMLISMISLVLQWRARPLD